MKKTTRATSCSIGVVFFIALTSSVWAASVATPVFTPDGGTYNTEQNVVITCATPGATIRYTLDGGDPNTGTVYEPNSIILIDHTQTLKARAWKEPLTPSAVKSATYTLVVVTPVFTPDGGIYTEDQTVTITCATPGATIHYTLSNDPNVIHNPTESDPVVVSGSSVLVDHNLTFLKARAWKAGWALSNVKSAIYQIIEPIQIETKSQLLAMAADVNNYDKSYILTADIDMGGQVFNAAVIAPYNSQAEKFTGSFNGNGYKIKNLIINSVSDYGGLFGYIHNATIKNLGLENVNLFGQARFGGGLVGYQESGTITNCYSTGSVDFSSYDYYSYVGGLVGYQKSGTITNCCSTGSVTSSADNAQFFGYYSYAGGLVGYQYSGAITNCYSTSSTHSSAYRQPMQDGPGSASLAGGLVGYQKSGAVMNCYSTGSVTSGAYVYSYAGGLVGDIDYPGEITNCYSTGSVSSDAWESYAGGLIGYNYNAVVQNSFWDTQTSGTSDGVGNLSPDPNGVQSKTTAQMQTLSTFTSAGWDFSDTDGNDPNWFFPTPPDYPKIFWEAFSLYPNPIVDTPAFSVAGGSYNTEQNVIITCATSGAVIHYTTSGLNPTESDPVIASGDSVYIDHSMTLKARAWKENMMPSSIKAASYQFLVETPVLTPDSGIYDTEQTVIITCGTPGATVRYTIDGGDPNNGMIIENGGSIIVSVAPPTILRVGAFRGGWTQSDTKTAFYYHFTGGSGTAQDPYQIHSKEMLLAIALDTNQYNKCFILTDDIDLNGLVFNAAIIAPNTSSRNGFWGTSFRGIFDGNGHKITNFTINGKDGSYLGLFGYIGAGSQVKNLGIDNFLVSGTSNSNIVGGLAGANDGSISNCYATGYVSGSYNVGGFIGSSGYSFNGTISNCYSTGEVSGFYGVGGFMGYINSDFLVPVSISNCYSTGKVSGSDEVGGFIGSTGDSFNGIISNCYSTGEVSGSDGVGGFIGDIGGSFHGIISNCYSSGYVSGSAYFTGGFMGDIGCFFHGTISNCYSTDFVSGSSYVGGFIGGIGCDLTGPVRISNCYSTGFISGSSYIGGFIGGIWGSTLPVTNNNFWDTQTSGIGSGSSTGVTGKTTAQMKTLSTFTSAGWDFATVWDICETTNYPRLQWQIPDADWVCPDGVSTEDLNYFIGKWLLNNCTSGNNYCGGVDIDASGKVDLEDWAIFAGWWLEGV